MAVTILTFMVTIQTERKRVLWFRPCCPCGSRYFLTDRVTAYPYSTQCFEILPLVKTPFLREGLT